MTDNPIVIVGSGIAGLSAALSVESRPVIVVTPGALGMDGSTWLAKGGIAAALGPDDSARKHAEDTMAAGAGRCSSPAVDLLCREGAAAIAWLQRLGTEFDCSEQQVLALGREAAHSAARIVHAGGDQTGKAVSQALTRAVKARGLELKTGFELRGLESDGTRVTGVHLRQETGETTFIEACDVVLATGGVGALYPCTTNPEYALGSGLACALEVGARSRDLCLVQFHPTALNFESAGPRAELLTEAIRGAGAHLIDRLGRRFMKAHHPDAELAPRDIVSRAIWQQPGEVFLDARSQLGKAFEYRFPAAFAACRKAGIDPRIDLMPVKPAAHYHMGGIVVDLDGRTSVENLWACGECASTGVHGANRLASNSLLEGVVFGRRLGRALSQASAPMSPRRNGSIEPRAFPEDSAWSTQSLQTVRSILWSGLGLIRDGKTMSTAEVRLRELLAEAAHRDRRVHLASRAALAMVRDGVRRRESMGAHFRTDYPPLERTA